VVLQHVSNIIFTVTVTTLPMFQTHLPRGAAQYKFEATVPRGPVASHCCNYCLTTPKLHFIKAQNKCTFSKCIVTHFTSLTDLMPTEQSFFRSHYLLS